MPERKWTRENIIRELQAIHSSGGDVAPATLAKRLPGMYNAGLETFGSSWKMYETAGIDPILLGIRFPTPKKTRRKWSTENIIEEIRQREKEGLNLSYASVARDGTGLIQAAQSRFGGWYDALAAAGVSPDEYRPRKSPSYWTKETIIAYLRRVRDNGEDLRPAALKRNHPAFMASAYKRFSDSEEMFTEAGIDPSSTGMRYKWTKEKIVRELKDRDSRGEDIRPGTLHDSDPAFYDAILRKFGNSHNLFTAAGINPDKHLKHVPSGHWTKKRIVQELRELADSGKDMSQVSIRNENNRLAIAAHRQFGGWYKALEAAGISEQRYRRRVSKDYWTNDSVLDEIRGLLSVQHCFSENNKLYSAAVYRFGTWEKAVEAAGFDYRVIRRRREAFTKESVIAHMKRMEADGVPLNATSVQGIDATLYAAAIREFGSYEKAIEALGLDYNKVNLERAAGKKRWTKDLILKSLREFYQGGRSIAAIKENQALYQAAINHFGTLKSAIIHAGIDYESLRGQESWTREKVVERIRQLHDAGADLSSSYAQRNYGGLYGSASTTYFGSWREALTADGLDYNKIRRDIHLEGYRGKMFEKYVRKMLKVLGWEVLSHQTLHIGGKRYSPDFLDPVSGTWIDAKLNSWGPGVDKTIERYKDHCPRITIIYLKGRRREWRGNPVEFLPVREFYPELRRKGAEDLIMRFEWLRRGEFRGDLRASFDSFLARSSPKVRNRVLKAARSERKAA